MATIILHRKVNIVVLTPGESLLAGSYTHAIVIAPDDAGWWLRFIDSQGGIDHYEVPYASYNEALWAAKAAAEFGFD
jgi:hypothetical protein